jgi:hypothetical protein
METRAAVVDRSLGIASDEFSRSGAKHNDYRAAMRMLAIANEPDG